MEHIFFEKQEGQLCAQHALNALLQGSYFTAVDLASIAQELDEKERINMAEAGMESQEYKEFIAGGSNNMDDSGFFSVQVIETALKVWQLELIPYNSKNMISDCARADPTTQKAFICNYHEHWFTIRKIGKQWFNLNSIKSGPELISNTYLSLLLSQLQSEGYSIFIVNGILPDSKADQVLQNVMIEKPPIPKLRIKMGKDAEEAVKEVNEATIGSDGFTDEERKQFFQTIAQSITSKEEEERRQLELAMALSLAASQGGATSPGPYGQGTSGLGSSSTGSGQSSTGSGQSSIGSGQSSKQSSSSVSLPSSSSMTTVTNPSSSASTARGGVSAGGGASASAGGGVRVGGGVMMDINQMTEDEMLDVALKMSLEAS